MVQFPVKTRNHSNSDIRIYENSDSAKDTRSRETFIFSTLFRIAIVAVPPVIALTDTAHWVFIFAFFFSLYFFLPVVVDCEFNLSQGLRRAETGNCGVLPNRIVNPTNRTGDDGSGGGGERDCYQALTDARHALYRSCTPPPTQSYRFTFRA